jgi:hypothetical protein
MHELSTETRLSLLERDAAERKALLHELANCQSDQTAMLHSLDTKVQIILDREVCPEPGACVGLRDAVASLELTRAEARGGWAVISGVAAGSAALVTLVVSFVLHRLGLK